ncbi:MAG: iron-containing alcohol dehydrogenase [Polaromonas sp.]|uniref:iron-containing alcohol dehydrogenase n=1 Tax=Polaromonas sp. TaxID=1869339 RepID=UPI00271E97B6|nr:iron-containing alcohol dehydrogenase [Polaromonas sp.]MDO9115029.1 iron-containing alcohol dehydrogenase [Polaromonas sp.]
MANLIGDMARAVGLPRLKRAAGVVTRRLPIPQPLLMVGPGASLRLAQALADFGHKKVFVVTDAVIVKLGLLQPVLDTLDAAGAAYVVFDTVTPDAPIPVIESGIARYTAEGCDALLAFGGGSVMDAAKVIGLAAANRKHPRELVGYFKGLRAPPPIYAVPTTAGTGSEVTVAAVISDPETHLKLVVADTRLVPRMAALDPALMTGLPAPITAATGMDALTHAVEAYIGEWGTPYTDRMALAAVAMIYRHLPRACAKPGDLVAREQMALASTYAGLAFTRANVGNVHAIAHQLGGRYGTPHGLANAIVLPAVLHWCGAAVQAKLATLAVRAGVGEAGEDEAELAQRFVASVADMNRAVGIPAELAALRPDDIPALARAACAEADANYPVPLVMSTTACESLLLGLLPDKPKPAPRRRAAKATTKVAKTAAGKTAKTTKARSPKPRNPLNRRTSPATG